MTWWVPVIGTTVARGSLVSEINSSGHYARFPLGPESWARSENPLDGGQGDARWSVMPDAGGSVRCLVTDLPEGGNAGFDVHVGRLGQLRAVTIDAKTVRTARTGGTALLFVGLYFDADDDGDFFAWSDGRGNTDIWDGFGADVEGVIFSTTDGEITIDGDTEFQLFNVDSDQEKPKATLADLQAGEVTGDEGDTIDGSTDAAIYVGAASAGKGTEEIVVDSLDVDRA